MRLRSIQVLIRYRKLAVFSLALFLASSSHAANLIGPPQGSAGVIEKQIEKEYQVEGLSPTKELPLLEVDVPETQLQIPQGHPVLINKVIFQGNNSIGNAKLQKLLAPYLGKHLQGKDLKEMCSILQEHYVKQGFILARVFPPEQYIKDQTLIIEVMEGNLGKIEVQGNKHYSSHFISKYLARYQGKAVNYHQLIRALLLLNENMDLNVGAIFKKGQAIGTADLILVVKDSLPLHIYTDVNNYGSSITTLYRSGTRIDYGNLVVSGDKLSFVEVFGMPFEHLNYSNAAYSIPLTSGGARLDFSYLYSGFKVDRLNELHLKGNSNIGGARFTCPWARTRQLATDLFLSFDFKQFKNIAEGDTDSFDKLRVLEVGTRFDYIDLIKGRTNGDLSFSAGIPNFLGGLSAVDSQCSRTGGGGRFFILNLDLRRVQQLPLDCFLLFNASGQGTLNKLPISEQFYVGGIDTVRGYPLAAALGDNGYYANMEFNAPIPFLANKKNRLFKKDWKDVLRLVGFVDTGGVFDNAHVRQERDPAYLTSSGVGLRLHGPWNFSANFDVGIPLTKEYKSSDTILYFKLALKIL